MTTVENSVLRDGLLHSNLFSPFLPVRRGEIEPRVFVIDVTSVQGELPK